MSESDSPGFKVRVFNIARNSFDGHRDLNNCVLSKIVPDAAERIVAVKVDDEMLQGRGNKEEKLEAYYAQLNDLKDQLGSCNQMLLASGGTIFMAEPEVVSEVRDKFFASQLDHCCRYGSLLVSSCSEGDAVFKEPITVRVVDYEHNEDLERNFAKSMKVGDCHGKISPRLASMLGAKPNTPFQFRLANHASANPLPAFIAKGTVAIDPKLTDNRGYDIVLDRSSIKGWAKNTGPTKVSQRNRLWQIAPKANLTPQQQQDLGYLPQILQKHNVSYQVQNNTYVLDNPSKEALDLLGNVYDWGSDRIACGTYQLSDLVIGNNSNAQVKEYNNSWQLMQWYSKEAIEQDILPATMAEAQYLKSIQDDYRLLAQYLVSNHDKKQQAIELEQSSDELVEEDKKEFALIEILRSDANKGELAHHPKVVDFCREQLRKRWLELAFKGAVNLESALAQPAEIKPGTIVAPHLFDGTEVIVTRYPIVNKDNIRKYTVDNQQAPELMHTKGAVFINPKQAMDYHQCDFDGDQLVVTPADLLPNIAAETRAALLELDSQGNDLNRDFNPVVKKEKQAYTQTDLKRMALAVNLNSVGKIANAIGRVNCAQPNPEADTIDQRRFIAKKVEMMDSLFDSLQIEVDAPKSATRYGSLYPNLDQDLKSPAYKLPFFDFKNDERVFSCAPMPTAVNPSVVDILPTAINQVWQSSRLIEMPVGQFKNLMQPNDALNDASKSTVDNLAVDILNQYNEVARSAKDSNEDPVQRKARFADLYCGIKEQIANAQLSSTAKDELATVLWQRQHTDEADGDSRRQCKKICNHFNPSVYAYLKNKHNYQQDLVKDQPALIIEAPFESSLFEAHGRRDCASYVKDMLEGQNQQFEATLHKTKPFVVFAVKNAAPHIKQQFLESFNSPEIKRYNDNTDLKIAKSDLFNRDRSLYNQLFSYRNQRSKYNPVKIVAPRHMNWVLGQHKRKSSLVFSVLPERITKALNQQVAQVTVVGKQKNAYAQHDLDSDFYRGRELNFMVKAFDDPTNDRHGSPMLYMQNPVDNKFYSLGMFGKDSSNLPLDANFTGQLATGNGNSLTVFIKPDSLSVTPKILPESPKKQVSKARRKEIKAVSDSNVKRLLQKRNRIKEKLQNRQRQNLVVNIKSDPARSPASAQAKAKEVEPEM